MKVRKLTDRACVPHNASMSGAGRAGVVMMLTLAGMAGGCVSVSAPDKPIVIELNINVKQEVVYRLAPGAQNTIEENSSIF